MTFFISESDLCNKTNTILVEELKITRVSFFEYLKAHISYSILNGTYILQKSERCLSVEIRLSCIQPLHIFLI